MKKSQRNLVILTLIFIFFLIYAPHFSYRFPLHVDEWHHISEGLRLGNYGEYFQVLKDQAGARFSGLEIGFHFFLFLLSGLFNLVLVYKFLPALWACFSVLVLFQIVYRKTGKNFFIAWLAMIFFASIRSNVNITGLWFFTPLTFAIPFIFLYIYFLSEGIARQNKKFILLALAIMAFLIPFHSVSVLFIMPTLLFYLLIHFRYVIKEYKFFLIFLAIPVIGALLFKYTLDIPWPELGGHIFNSLQFRYGWGVLELHNTLSEVYSWVSYILAFVGVIFILVNKEIKKYTFYLLWPITLFVLIVIYKLIGISYLSPYQRNFYYLALALPLFSAIGLYSLIKLFDRHLSQLIEKKKYTRYIQNFITISVSLKINEKYTKYIQRFVTIVLITLAVLLTLLLSFTNYYNLPPRVALYHLIEEQDYKTLNYLLSFPPAKVMANPLISATIYPITRHQPVGTLVFYGTLRDVEIFYFSETCETKQQIIKKHQVKYIISSERMNCDFNLIFQRENHYIYQVNK